MRSDQRALESTAGGSSGTTSAMLIAVGYATQLRRYGDLFDDRQILTLTMDELLNRTTATFRLIADFIGVDAIETPDLPLANRASTPRLACGRSTGK